MAKNKKYRIPVNCEQHFLFALVLLNGAPLNGYNPGGNQEKKFTMCHFLTGKNNTWLHPCSFFGSLI